MLSIRKIDRSVYPVPQSFLLYVNLHDGGSKGGVFFCFIFLSYSAVVKVTHSYVLPVENFAGHKLRKLCIRGVQLRNPFFARTWCCMNMDSCHAANDDSIACCFCILTFLWVKSQSSLPCNVIIFANRAQVCHTEDRDSSLFQDSWACLLLYAAVHGRRQ